MNDLPADHGVRLVNLVAAISKAHSLGQITDREFNRRLPQIWAQFPRMAR